MDNFEQQKQFFEANWPQMQAHVEQGGGPAVIDFISGHRDELERRVLFSFARQGLVHKEWQGRNLDDYIAVAEAGIAECLRQAEAEVDSETKKKRINSANIISYNLGADLAFCFDYEGQRTEAHYRRGLQAGNDCLRWRRELGNPPHTHSMAHWLRGAHRLALGDLAGALVDFEDSLHFAELAAQASGKDASLAGGDGAVVLGHGWVGLTRAALGDSSAHSSFDEVLAIFRKQGESDDEEVREDASWYLMQLQNGEKLLLNR